jgi:osmotically-inducible protein OsmY
MMKKLLYVALAGMALVQLHGCSSMPIGGEAGGPGTLDRRTAGAVIGDQEIEIRSKNRLRDAFPIKIANAISSTSYNRQLLLTGQVPDEATRARAVEVVKGIPELRDVHNELSVAGSASLASKANDTSITGQVKTRLLRDERVPGNQIKVVTEAGNVYLMGLVNRAEAAAATEVARTTSGVAKVVVLFEHLD